MDVEPILAAIKEQIKQEVSGDNANMQHLKSLLQILTFVTQRSGDSVDEVTESYGIDTGVPRVRAVAPGGSYVSPPPTERIMEIAESFIKSQLGRTTTGIESLASSYIKLKDVEPGFAERLRKLIDHKISTEEKTIEGVSHDNLSTDAPG